MQNRIKTYKAYYAVTSLNMLRMLRRKEPAPVSLSSPDDPQPNASHVFIREVGGETLGDAYSGMQGERWSPNGEGNAVVEKAGTDHVSMSTGDVLVDPQGRAFMCAMYGWIEVEITDPPADPPERDVETIMKMVATL